MDIDDFKNVNDTYGHLFGDEVILTVASAVRDGFRSSDITGRIGGDEFAVFARDALDESVIRKRCRQITARLAEIDYPNEMCIRDSVQAAQAGLDYDKKPSMTADDSYIQELAEICLLYTSTQMTCPSPFLMRYSCS